ncbi:sec-independent protein translocase protein TatA [Streptomyces sp. SceaMP-e96]|uniref:Sec-independent protein translocase subunit TatA n=1 Tax=unclassified Streptomyces TaxID=2593676 RepID=UPI000823EBB3|nr:MULTISPECIES: Sec-independent protein translocase subunit TatA [unclassified Streptomyces]MYT17110.1 twin-arginine translocase TatA/TatE family subunit [Streptomyces sp. SID4951]SCK39818.1 sec-independent protein translocase protein TatA [Streptomyces sp. SceaMP-e96]
MFGLSEIAIILIVVILIFGAKKLPDLARSMGKSARILKSEARAMKTEPTPSANDAPTSGTGTPRVIQATPGEATSPRPTTQPDTDAPQR